MNIDDGRCAAERPHLDVVVSLAAFSCAAAGQVELVVARTTRYRVGAAVASDEVVAVAALNDVVEVASQQRIVAAKPLGGAAGDGRGQQIVGRGADPSFTRRRWSGTVGRKALAEVGGGERRRLTADEADEVDRRICACTTVGVERQHGVGTRLSQYDVPGRKRIGGTRHAELNGEGGHINDVTVRPDGEILDVCHIRCGPRRQAADRHDVATGAKAHGAGAG